MGKLLNSHGSARGRTVSYHGVHVQHCFRSPDGSFAFRHLGHRLLCVLVLLLERLGMCALALHLAANLQKMHQFAMPAEKMQKGGASVIHSSAKSMQRLEPWAMPDATFWSLVPTSYVPGADVPATPSVLRDRTRI